MNLRDVRTHHHHRQGSWPEAPHSCWPPWKRRTQTSPDAGCKLPTSSGCCTQPTDLLLPSSSHSATYPLILTSPPITIRLPVYFISFIPPRPSSSPPTAKINTAILIVFIAQPTRFVASHISGQHRVSHFNSYNNRNHAGGSRR